MQNSVRAIFPQRGGIGESQTKHTPLVVGMRAALVLIVCTCARMAHGLQALPSVARPVFTKPAAPNSLHPRPSNLLALRPQSNSQRVVAAQRGLVMQQANDDAKLIATFVAVSLGGYGLILLYDVYLNGLYIFGTQLIQGVNSVNGWS